MIAAVNRNLLGPDLIVQEQRVGCHLLPRLEERAAQLDVDALVRLGAVRGEPQRVLQLGNSIGPLVGRAERIRKREASGQVPRLCRDGPAEKRNGRLWPSGRELDLAEPCSQVVNDLKLWKERLSGTSTEQAWLSLDRVLALMACRAEVGAVRREQCARARYRWTRPDR
eukprot:4484766-Pleurochrysis_carterae.AAC.9